LTAKPVLRPLIWSVVFLLGCAGSMPSVPNRADAILAKADNYFREAKYYQAGELYKQFLSRHPGHDRSDYAQFRLAESYFEDSEYPLAAVEYTVLLNNYGYSEYVDDALFKIGVCFYHQAPKPPRDQQKAQDALSKFEQFFQTFPNSPLIPEAQRYIRLLNEKLAEKDFKNGYYYYRRHKPGAALIYFQKVIDKYPENPFWYRCLFYKAMILQDRGDMEGAKDNYERVVAYDGDLDVKDDARLHLKQIKGQ
jgi:outer membrane protein assembly factor BamD